MKVLFLAVGKTTDKRIAALVEEYAARVRHYVPFDIEVVPDLKNAKSLSSGMQKEREGEALLRRFREGDCVVLLDEGGREHTSGEFAAFLSRKQQTAARRLVFVAGGPYGFSPAVYAATGERLSLSRMTFSHQMVRLFFVEQLYRAMTILRGEPYHHS